MKILLFGKNGQIGWELQRSLAPLGEVISFGRHDVDFGNPLALQTFLGGLECDVIVNAAAYTAVDQAESEAEAAHAINERSVAILAAYAAAKGCWLIHYSTDYVFDGTAERPYLETDKPSPVSVYGLTKWRSEIAITESGCRHLIFRTSWIHSSRGKNFVRTILALAGNGRELRVTADQVGAPTRADLVADVTAHALRQALSQGDSISGIYHLAASGEVSWYEYARWVISEASSIGLNLATLPEKVVPITMDDLPRAARRPMNCRLDTTKLNLQFSLQMPDWRVGVMRTIQEIAEANDDA